MARRIKWSRLNSRDRMQHQGVEDKKADSVDPPKTRSLKNRPSQAELREQATAAFLTWRARQTSEKNKKNSCGAADRGEYRQAAGPNS